MSTAEGDEQDLTRKQRREQARAQRRQLEQEQAASALRRTRLTQLGIVSAIVVAVIVIIVVATSGGGKKHSLEREHSGKPSAVVTEISSLLAGIPENGNTLGIASAPVTLQYFGDLECPVCRQFTEGALRPLIESYVRTGKLKIEFRALQTATPERETFKTQQLAALAAGEQQKAWYYIELFYHQQGEERTGYVTESYLQGLAKQVPGLDVNKWSSERSDRTLANSIETDAQAANTSGFSATPSFALGKSGTAGKKFEAGSYTDPTSYETAIAGLLKH